MARNYRKEYDNYHSSSKQKKRRAGRNTARRKSGLKVGDNRDVHHKDGNPTNNSPSNTIIRSQSSNRSFRRNKNAGKA